jgi:phosphomannomutase
VGQLQALSGNELGVLLGHYLLTQTKPKPPKPLVMTTIVSSVQLRDMAHQMGALYDETLTGFKWIANRAMEREHAEGADFIFGYEEALGYTVGPLVRDKDGIGAALVCADMATWCKSRGTTLIGYLEEIQREFGLYVAEQKSVTMPGAQGAHLITAIMANFRGTAPERISGLRVVAVRDYKLGTAVVQGVTRKLSLPSSDVLAYELEGGAQVTLRPSGTEPKIKYYFELKETLAPKDPVGHAKERARTRLHALIADFLTLAEQRAKSI